MKSVLSLIIILFLITSTIPFGFAEILPNDSTLSETPTIVSSTPKEFRNISVSLHESVGISTNSPQKKNTLIQPSVLYESESFGKMVYLSEDLKIISFIHEQSVKHVSFVIQPQTTFDRILQIEQTKDRKKNSKIESLYFNDLDQQQSKDLISIDSNIIQTTFFADPFNIISDLLFEQNILESINIFEEKSITNIVNSVFNFDSSFIFDNSFVVVIFAPLVFFLFIFAEDVKFKFEKVRPFLSLIFAVIILSTVVITPYSISSVYWPEAYADTGDMDESIYDNTTASDDISSSSTPAEDTETSEATTSDSTDSPVDSTSSSSTPAEDTESTEVSSNQTSINNLVTNNTSSNITSINNLFTNSTTTNSTTTEVIPTNSTTTDVIPVTNSTIPVIVPNATESWSFDTQVNGSRFIGDVYIEESDSSLILDGDGYLSNDGNSTSDLSNLSVTAWVNPDYSGGSAEFTVISKEKAFALTINNNIEPKHIATFAVFDGIKWHSVQTTEEIGDNWSHLAATFNGTTLSIYTNSTISNVNESIEIIELTIEGQLVPKSIESIESTSDVVVGATLDNNRSLDDITKQFYGEIKEVNIFDIYLSSQQITEIYLQTLPMIESLYNNTVTEVIEEQQEETIIINVLEPQQITNATSIDTTNVTSIDTTNATDTSLTFNKTQTYVPIETELLNKELNKLTISTWINPSYESGSPEFTVVSKESSFVLGINNIYSPEKVPTFAIFDGISWTKISGTTQVYDWSNLVAVINGTEISLYLNGHLEATTILPESFVILDGEVITIDSSIAENNSDLIIGAYLDTFRDNISLSNHFSGVIDDVLVYKEALSEDEIGQIYAGYVTPSENNKVPFEDDLLSFTDTVTVFLNDEPISDTIHVVEIDVKLKFHQLHNHLHLEIM